MLPPAPQGQTRCEQMEALLRYIRRDPKIVFEQDCGAAIDQVLKMPDPHKVAKAKARRL